MARNPSVSLLRGIVFSGTVTFVGLLAMVVVGAFVNAASTEEALVGLFLLFAAITVPVACYSLLIAAAVFLPGSWFLRRQQRADLKTYMAYGAILFAIGGLALEFYVLPIVLVALAAIGAAAGASFWWGGVRPRPAALEREPRKPASVAD